MRVSRSGTATNLAAALFFSAVAVALFYPALFLGKLPRGYDIITLGVPFHEEFRRSLTAHELPLWMPDVLGGMPGIASCNVVFLFPTDLLGMLCGLGFPRQLGLDGAVDIALAGIGTFLFLRRLDRGVGASSLGAVFFMLSGSQMTSVCGGFYNFLASVALLPWILWAVHRAVHGRSLFAWGLCGAGFALQILAVGAQIFVYSLAAAALFALLEARRSGADAPEGAGAPGTMAGPVRAMLGLGLALGLAALLASPQLWPTLRYVPYSTRQGYSYSDFLSGSIYPSEALFWLVPGWHAPSAHGATSGSTNEYFGLLPWILAAAAAAALWRREPRIRLLTCLSLWAFFLAQNGWAPFYPLFQRIPVISGFRYWSRDLFLVSFSVCVLAAYGWDALWAAGTRTAALRGARAGFALAAAIVALAWALAPSQAANYIGWAKVTFQQWRTPEEARLACEQLSAVIRHSADCSLAFLALFAALPVFWTKRFSPILVLLAALAFHSWDEGLMLGHYIKFIDADQAVDHPHFRQPPPPPPGVEPWRVEDLGYYHPNNDVLLGYENLAGFESVPMGRYDTMKLALKSRPGEWRNLMNVRYYFRHIQARGAAPMDSVVIVENRSAFPRAWLAGESVKVSGDAQACALLHDPRFNPRDVVALPVDGHLGGRTARGSVHWISRSPQTFSVGVSTDEAAALVVSNFWYPDWRAEVDGTDTAVLEADGGLQAVLLGPGGHRVDFHMDPVPFYNALAACLAGLVLLAGLGWMELDGKKG